MRVSGGALGGKEATLIDGSPVYFSSSLRALSTPGEGLVVVDDVPGVVAAAGMASSSPHPAVASSTAAAAHVPSTRNFIVRLKSGSLSLRPGGIQDDQYARLGRTPLASVNQSVSGSTGVQLTAARRPLSSGMTSRAKRSLPST
jgi:hypothetical protein